MSPNEDDLRAALRDGEGDRPDPDATLDAARTAATRRRTRLLSTVSSAAVVAAIAVTVGILATGHDDTQRAGDTNPTQPSNSSVSSSGSSDAPSAVSCPAVFSPPAPQSGSSPASTKFGLVGGEDRGITVCAYGSTDAENSVRPAQLTITGNAADRFVASLNAAPTTRPHTPCPLFRVANDHRLVFLGVTGGPLYTTLGNAPCSVVLTNGTSNRYAYVLSADVGAEILALKPTPR